LMPLPPVSAQSPFWDQDPLVPQQVRISDVELG